jgi:tripartite-type tricarboxylate transporter receptor subunit TctC
MAWAGQANPRPALWTVRIAADDIAKWRRDSTLDPNIQSAEEKKILVPIFTAALLAAVSFSAAAQSSSAGLESYPSRPVRFIVPLPPGGSPDTIARVLNAPDIVAKLAAHDIDVETGTPQALAQRIREDYARWGKVVRATRLRAE